MDLKSSENIPAKRSGMNLPEGLGSPRNKRFIILYSACLFLFAAGIVLLSYLAQERTNNQMLDAEVEKSNQKVVSAMQTVQDLRDQNDSLKTENEQLTARLEELEREVTGAKKLAEGLTDRVNGLENSLAETEALLAGQKNAAEKRALALDRLWQMEKFYSWGSYSAAREVDREMKRDGLIDYLPTEEGADGVSAAEEYDRLVKLIY